MWWFLLKYLRCCIRQYCDSRQTGCTPSNRNFFVRASIELSCLAIWLGISSFNSSGSALDITCSFTIWYHDFSLEETPSEKASFLRHNTDLGSVFGRTTSKAFLIKYFSILLGRGTRSSGLISQNKSTNSRSKKGTLDSSPKWDRLRSTLSPSYRWISCTRRSRSLPASSALGARQKYRYPIMHQSAPSPLSTTVTSVCSEIFFASRYCPTEALIVVMSQVSVTMRTFFKASKPSCGSQMNSVCSDPICAATSLAKTMSVPSFIPILKVLSFSPRSWQHLDAMAATRLESSPPESRQPIGRSDMSLLLIASVTVETIFSQSC